MASRFRYPGAIPPKKRSLSGQLARLSLFFLAIVLCLLASYVLVDRWQGTRLAPLDTLIPGDPSLNPIESIYLKSYLASRAEELAVPVSAGTESVVFTISPGQNASDVADNLLRLQVIQDKELFLRYVHYTGIDSRLEAGKYVIDPQLTLPQLATHLTKAGIVDVTVRFLEGWRVEEMAEYLAVVTPARIEADEFLSIANGQHELDLTGFASIVELPAGSRLEGFLYPDTYQIPVETDAEELIYLMLGRFDEVLVGSIRNGFANWGLSVIEGTTLASIVQKEAVIDVEKPVIARVFLNRLANDMLLQADPTVQYGIGKQENNNTWWKTPLDISDLQFASPYNTYMFGGLPPGPIASPGVNALLAVSNPAEAAFLYFVADCEDQDNGAHIFSLTYEEHLANVQACRQQN